jgi:hypothetical protein
MRLTHTVGPILYVLSLRQTLGTKACTIRLAFGPAAAVVLPVYHRGNLPYDNRMPCAWGSHTPAVLSANVR